MPEIIGTEFLDTYAFEQVVTEHFTRECTDSFRPFVLSGKNLPMNVLCIGALRYALMTGDYIYYDGRLFPSKSFVFNNGKVQLKKEIADNPDIYCLQAQSVSYSGSEFYLNPEKTFDISVLGSSYRRDYRDCNGINLNFVYAPGPDELEHRDGYHREPKQIKWSSSIFTTKNTLDSKDAIDTFSNAINNMPRQFGDALQYIISDLGMSHEEFAALAGVSARNISRYMVDSSFRPKLRTVVAMCVALHLFPCFSMALIERAGYNLDYPGNDEEAAYRLILNCFYQNGLEECNRFLCNAGLHPLTNGMTLDE